MERERYDFSRLVLYQLIKCFQASPSSRVSLNHEIFTSILKLNLWLLLVSIRGKIVPSPRAKLITSSVREKFPAPFHAFPNTIHFSFSIETCFDGLCKQKLLEREINIKMLWKWFHADLISLRGWKFTRAMRRAECKCKLCINFFKQWRLRLWEP